MFGTVIIDAYRKDEAIEMAKAIETQNFERAAGFSWNILFLGLLCRGSIVYWVG